MTKAAVTGYVAGDWLSGNDDEACPLIVVTTWVMPPSVRTMGWPSFESAPLRVAPIVVDPPNVPGDAMESRMRCVVLRVGAVSLVWTW